MSEDLLSDPVHIACVSNAGYIPHFATMLRSLAASNRPQGLTVHLVHDETVTPDMRHQLQRMAESLGIGIDFRCPDEQLLEQLPPRNRHYPAVVWFNILLPEVLTDLDRVLYIDGDTLVMQDLRPLWSTDLDDALIGAVAQPPTAARNAEVLTRLGLEVGAPYLNSGVILMDLKKMRGEGATQRILAVGRDQIETLDGGELLYLMDQDALNEACAGRWLQLHPRWNTLAVLYVDRTVEGDAKSGNLEYAEAATSPAIVHFEGLAFVKPWNYRCVHPFQHVYLAYRRDTPWPLEQLDDATVIWKLLRPFPGVQVWLGVVKHRLQRRRGQPKRG